jgi:hypothetical protein
MRRLSRISPLLMAALALTLLVLSGGGVMLSRSLPRAIEQPSGSGPRPDATPEARSPVTKARPLPRLLELSPSRWELLRPAVAELTPVQEAWLAELGQKARRQAATEVGLSPQDAQLLEPVYQATDTRLAGLETRVDREHGILAGDVQGDLRARAREELAELTRQLGEARARALRIAENRAYRDLWRTASGDDVSPAMMSVARRRMTFLWMGMGEETSSEP